MMTRICILLLSATCWAIPAPAQTANRFDIVIDEIFPDPTPVIGLPNSEFIELKNISGNAINLRGWKISDGTATATISSSFVLKPDSFVIVCPNASSIAFAVFGTSIGVSSFPSLNNNGDLITLYSPEGRVIHAVDYDLNWYRNDVKSDGGWTLEMIDTKNPCQGAANWKASINLTGGTPGRKNSVDGINKDEQPPALLRTVTTDSITITALFDEPLDSADASVTSHYTMDNNMGNPLTAIPVSPLFNSAILRWPAKLNARTVYHLTVNNVSDCSGNSIASMNKSKAGIPEAADSLDIAINEILFNPSPGGYDYVELYNRSNKITDLRQLYFAGRGITGNLTNIKQTDTGSFLFFPGEYLAFSSNLKWLQENYPVKDIAALVETGSLPTLPDDKGNLVLLNQQGQVVEEIQYDSKWHFALINNEEGVSLERINYDEPVQDKNNWTSAASTSGFGTPGYQNSEFRADLRINATLTATPSLFSPDNDGIDDFVTIRYRVPGPGYVANITIFDANGRPVRYLASNATLGLSGDLRWNGLNDHAARLPVGVYIVYTEIFNLQGKTAKFKNAITLARQF